MIFILEKPIKIGWNIEVYSLYKTIFGNSILKNGRKRIIYYKIEIIKWQNLISQKEMVSEVSLG